LIFAFILGFSPFRTKYLVVHHFYAAMHNKVLGQIKSTAKAVTTVVSKACHALTVYTTVTAYIYHQF